MTEKLKKRTVIWFAEIGWILGFLGACPAFMTLMGYWADHEWLTRWTDVGTSPMALNTAVALLCTAVGMMFVASAVIKEINGERRSSG
jgi:hypothetical protein